MTKKEQRIAIAKDVLKILRYLDVKQGVYVKGWFDDDNYSENKQVKDYFDINKNLKQCSVCALGACFVSCLRIYNKVKCKDVNSCFSSCSTNFCRGPLQIYFNCLIIFKKLKEVFSKNQLYLIENVFEGSQLNPLNKYNMPDVYDFYKNYPDSKCRLRAIMKNIIKNNGDFKL